MSKDLSHIIDQIRHSQDVFEKARLMEYLKQEEGVRVVELAAELDMKPTYVSHFLRLNRLPIILVDGYYGKMVSTSHLFIIARLPDHESMIEVYEQVLERSLSSAQTEELVREALYQINDDGTHRLSGVEIKRMEQEISRSLGEGHVKIIQTRIRCKLQIEVNGDLESTSRVLRKMHRKLTEKTFT